MSLDLYEDGVGRRDQGPRIIGCNQSNHRKNLKYSTLESQKFLLTGIEGHAEYEAFGLYRMLVYRPLIPSRVHGPSVGLGKVPGENQNQLAIRKC